MENNLFGKLKDFIQEKPVVAIVGAVVLILLIWGGIKMFSGGDSEEIIPTYPAKKGPLKISITEDGTIQPREKLIVKNEVEGSTTITYIIDEGAKVKQGDLLVELDSSTLSDNKVDQEITVQSAEASFISAREAYEVAKNQAQSDIDEAELTYDFAKQDLEKYLKGEYPNLLREAESDITTAEEELSSAKDTLDWSKKLYAEKYLSESELNTDQLSYNQKAISVELKKAAKDLLVNYTYKRKVAELESDVKQDKSALERTTRKAKASIVEAEATLKSKEAEYERQQAKLTKIENQLAKTKVYAPADGTVTYATSAEQSRSRFGSRTEPLELGSSVQERQELIHLPTDAGFNVEISVPESSLDKVKAGLPVRITIDTIPNITYTGKVTSVSNVVNAKSAFMNPDLKVYDTVIAVDNDANISQLRSGMSCKAEIIIDQYAEAVYVPLQAVTSVGGKPTVYIVKRNKQTARTVETGLDNSTVIRIVSGVKEGEIVSLAPPLDKSSVVEQNFEQLSDVSESDLTAARKAQTSGADTGATTQGQQQGQQGQQGGMPSGQAQQGAMPSGQQQGQASGQSEQGRQGGMPGGGDMISNLDKDSDGKVSKAEFSGPENFFSTMDTDGDGYITKTEAAAMQKTRQAQGQTQGENQSSQSETKTNRYSTTGSISGSSSSGGGGGEGGGGGGGGGAPGGM